jgi:hypothetical protein
MLDIQTFDAKQGGNVIYKALAHPLAAEGIARMYGWLRDAGPVVIFDPDGIADALLVMHPDAPAIADVFVQNVAQIGALRAGRPARPLTELAASGARSVLVAAFDAARIQARIATLLPPDARVATLDEARLPAELMTNPARVLDRLNFATNYAFFRDQDGLSTRLVTANYWAGYGARAVRLWLRLFDAEGAVLASWEQPVPPGPGGIVLDSAEIRARFGLPAFTGQLFIHAIGVAGHDVVKYALDTYAQDGASLSCTHDANAWPSDRYAGLPAPRADERVILWVQNSHAMPIPDGAMALDRMGSEQPVPVPGAVPAYATRAVDVAALLPGLHWPAQIELRAGRHVVRPRYEVVQAGRTRIAHVNVERVDLQPEPAIASLSNLLGRGFLLPFPILPRGRFRTTFQPTPMAVRQANLPLRLDVFDPEGTPVAQRFLGCLPRDHALALDLDEYDEGHAELVYDFRDGGAADGWMHTLVRYQDRDSGHAAETSFGAHVYNTAMTWRDEPQSYSGPPPGLSTRLFLKLGDTLGGVGRRSFACLIYAASAPWVARSSTSLMLHDGAGEMVAQRELGIACCGSAMIWPHELFGEALLQRAGAGGYVLIRDTSCRLFGYHGLMDDRGGFSLDHMFGF